MLIFLDSNILCANFFMKGPSFEMMEKVGHVVLGQIVVDEVCNKYSEKLKEQIQKLQKTLDELNGILLSPIDISFNNLLETESEKYKEFLEMFIIRSGMTMADDYPNISHKEVVDRALKRKKPFKIDGGTGYRDYLVWLTCLNIAKLYSNEDMHFITNNTRDFSDPSDKNMLHPDLLCDLRNNNIEAEHFHYWSSVKNFINEFASIRIEEIEEFKRIVFEIKCNDNGFYKPIQKFIDNSVTGINISSYDVLVLGENAILKQVVDLSEFNIESLSSLDNTEYLLDISVDCIGIFNSNLSLLEINQLEELEYNFEILNCDRNNDCLLETIVNIQLHLRAIYSKEVEKISSIELDYIEDYNCTFCS